MMSPCLDPLWGLISTDNKNGAKIFNDLIAHNTCDCLSVAIGQLRDSGWKRRLRVLACLVGLLTVVGLWAPTTRADVSRPGDGKTPVRVAISIFLLDLDGVDNVNQSFEANVFYMASWNDPRLAHAGPGKISRSLNDVWHPRLQIVNQQNTWNTFPKVVKIDPRGNVVYRQRLWGNFSQPLELKNFPFDSQKMQITIIAAGYGPDEVVMVPYGQISSGIGPALSIPDWDIVEWQAAAGEFETSLKLKEYMASFTLSFEAQRRYHFYVVKVIIPLMLIMAMSWVVFWMDPKAGGGAQIGISVTAMLTLIAYTFSVGTNLPKVPYLTRIDYFILSSTILVFLALVEVTTNNYLARVDRLELARRIDNTSRVVFPLAFLAMTTFSLGFR